MPAAPAPRRRGLEGCADHGLDPQLRRDACRDPLLDKRARTCRRRANATGTVILLAHDPRRLTEAAALKIPLVLSGHTHGGQVVLPVLGPVAAEKFPVVYGTAREAGTTLFVSRGLGTVYVPVRVNCPPEVAVLTLTPAELAER